MALINKIREKSGIAVAVIAFSLILFMVGGDLMSPNSILGGSKNQVVGEISGKEINIKDFQSRVDGFRQNYEAQSGRSLNENELGSLRDQAWNQFVVDIAYKKQFEKLDKYTLDYLRKNHKKVEIELNIKEIDSGIYTSDKILSIKEVDGETSWKK